MKEIIGRGRASGGDGPLPRAFHLCRHLQRVRQPAGVGRTAVHPVLQAFAAVT